MHQGLPESSNPESQTNTLSSSLTSSQHGFLRPQPSLSDHDGSRQHECSPSPGFAAAAAGAIDPAELGRGLSRLSVFDDSDADSDARSSASSPTVAPAGQRIADYENALITSAARRSPRPPMGFKVIKRPNVPFDGVRLTDFPNEILTQILSHLHPDSHGSVALVSKRFYALVTTPYAWRVAFLRYFPGRDGATAADESSRHTWDNDSSDIIRSESRYFARLTSLASWRSEYLLRTRLLRSVARGKPGSIGASARSSQSGKKASAVLTYNSKLPWLLTNVHGTFAGGKKGPRIVHGASDLGVGSVSDPTTGRVEKWGLDDPFSFAQLDEMFPNLKPYGIGDGPAAVPNVMDVSQPYGVVGGEGFPGGRVHFRVAGELRGRYLSQDSAIINMVPEIPKIPQLSDAVSSVWIAKNSNVPSMTQSMIGILAGSTLGVVTSYALSYDSTGPRFSNGDMTARWVLSPGVPIVDIKVDDGYNQKRKALGRAWAVALNALGEVYYLTELPTPPLARTKGEEAMKAAWHAGRTAYWELIESTSRTARPDEFDKYAIQGAYSPRSSSNSMNLSKEQTVGEAQEIEKFFHHKPSHFRKVCEGWDMRRKIEADFAGGDEAGAGEAIFVITCGHEKDEPAGVCRYLRTKTTSVSSTPGAVTSAPQPQPISPSIFGGTQSPATPALADQPSTGSVWKTSSGFQPGTPGLDLASPMAEIEEWRRTEYSFGNNSTTTKIAANAVDMSTFAVLAPFEDPLHYASRATAADPSAAVRLRHATGEIPGRRSRSLAVGTNTGSIFLWNMRESPSSSVVSPMRVIHTDSPEISSLAVSALYVVHGGSDGLVQAWDPLGSSPDPIRTLNARSSGRIPRHILNANPALQDVNYSAVGAIFLDPDPTVLRGVLSFGTFVRFWTYSSTGQSPGRRRRLRHSDIHGRLATRRSGGTVSSYIAAEEAELRREQEHESRELMRLRSRFGVGLGDLTEEEAIQYAQMISEDAFHQDEQRRTSASDTGSAADIGETGSSTGSLDTVTPEPSLSGASPTAGGLQPLQEETDDDYEAQIQRAIRLSLLEGVNDEGQSPRGNSSGEYEFQVKVKSKKDKKKGKPSSSTSPSASTPVIQYGESSRGLAYVPADVGVNADDDLALALRLSLEEEEARQWGERFETAGLGIQSEEYPSFEVNGKGKGKC
ncbi:hypothetical protein B0H66DRAFT_591342 [Apodospora peruviana]|uniref:F-box domain-containing protein n=1 Tax=Apodospora peruviana TaxID=516989 RepID=A0AAE0I4U2_9PEZI|nr:hypothetical protein B0H66DRAFT_591342 [Apodospora peruviana]